MGGDEKNKKGPTHRSGKANGSQEIGRIDAGRIRPASGFGAIGIQMLDRVISSLRGDAWHTTDN
jgi:hypothetical protein